MKTGKTFAVRIDIDANSGFCGVNCNFKKSNLYFSDMIMDKRNEILQIIPFLKKIKNLEVKMVTIVFETYNETYNTTYLDQWRFIGRYGGNKIAKFNGRIFDFDDENAKTDINMYQFISRYSDMLNNVAYYEYLKYISDIER